MRALCCEGGHWLSRKANSLRAALQAFRVSSLAQRSNAFGRAGMMQRSAALIAAAAAGDSPAPVSTMARVMPFFSSIESVLASLPAGTHSTGMSLSPRAVAHFDSDIKGSVSMRKTRSPFSWGDGEAGGKRALPRAAFLGHECNRTHEVQ